jgi:ribose 5-phosphate isomerase B
MADVLALVADHAGFELKNALKGVLTEHGVPTAELGPQTAGPVDYPDVAAKLAAALKRRRAQRGLMVCGSGIAIVADLYPWIWATMGHDLTPARLARERNDANGRALGARLLGLKMARHRLLTFFKTPFAGGRPARCLAKTSAAVPQP